MTAKDIISRAALKRLTTDLANHLLGLDAEAVALIETQNQRVEDRRADLVARMRSVDGDEFLLHVEIANDNQREMPLRMLRYLTDIRLAGHGGPLRQYLLYIGSAPLRMPDCIDEPETLDYRYGLVDMHRIDCAGLLAQDNPDALVLAVLCDFGEREASEVVTHIVLRLKQLLGDNEPGFREYMAMLEVLSENRDLQHVVEESEQMLTEIEIERLPSYRIGETRGRALNQAEVVRRLLLSFKPEKVASLLGISVDEVLSVANDEEQ